MYYWITPRGRVCGATIPQEDDDVREAREYKMILAALRASEARERQRADSRLRAWRLRFQLANDVE